MATVISSLTPDNTTDAAFRAWGSGISTALQSLLVLVTQTGQINWSTVTRPTTINIKSGFEVYRFNDAAQSTAPIFIKAEYGSASTSGAVTKPALYITVGKSVDGSGNIGGVIFSQRETVTASSTTPTATPKNCYFGNGDGSCLVISLFPSDIAYTVLGSYMVLERSRSSLGVATADGIWWQFSGLTLVNNESGDVNEAADYITTSKTSLPFGAMQVPFALSTNIPLSNGVTTPVFTGYVVTPSRLAWIPTALLCCAQADLGIGVVATSAMAGIDYISLGAAGQCVDVARQQYAVAMLRWD
jgi:hypothetical protein